MKSTITTLILVTMMVVTGLAQGPRKERLAAYKVAYITQKLQLTPEEAQKFWPVYNEYQEKLEKITRATRMEARQKWLHLDELTDAEIKALIQAYSDRKNQELDLFEEYNEKFMTVLPVRKVAELYLAEKQYKKEMLQKLRERKNAGGE